MGGFPAYDDPIAARLSLEHLRANVRPEKIFLGHNYRDVNGTPLETELHGQQALSAIQQSLDLEAKIAAVAIRYLEQGISETPSPYSPFGRVAEELSYKGNALSMPYSFFMTLHGYRTRYEQGTLPG